MIFSHGINPKTPILNLLTEAMADKPETRSSLHPAYTVTNIQQRIRVLDSVKLSYHSWVRLFRLLAEGFDVLDHIDGTPAPIEIDDEYPAWKKLDAIVLQWIYGTLSDDLFDRVLTENPPLMKLGNGWKTCS